MQHFLEDLAAKHEVIVLTGRCYERELVPYKAVDGLIDALSHYLARLPSLEVKAYLPRNVAPLARVFPVLRRVAPIAEACKNVAVLDVQELRQRAFMGLRELLARLADAKPLVLAIDDLQWGDADSAALLTELLKPPDAPVLMALGCHRSEDAPTSPFLQAIDSRHNQAAAWPERRELAVEPLSLQEAFELAMAELDPTNPRCTQLAEQVARESGGSPLFVYELSQAVSSTTKTESGWKAYKLVLDEVLWNRVQQLPVLQRELLEVIAVAGQPLPVTVACTAAGLEKREQAALDQLRIGRLIRSTGMTARETVESYHDRVRETVVAHLKPDVLTKHHRRLAQTLEASDSADPEALAVHWQAAGQPSRAGYYYSLAAAQASDALAFERAAALYRLALGLCPATSDDRQQLQIHLAEALANAGRGLEAAEAYRLVAESLSPTKALEYQRRRAMQLLISGHMDDGIAAIRTVLQAFGLKLPKTSRMALISLLLHRAQLYIRGLHFNECAEADLSSDTLAQLDTCWTIASGQFMTDIIRGAELQSRFLLLALRSGESSRIGGTRIGGRVFLWNRRKRGSPRKDAHANGRHYRRADRSANGQLFCTDGQGNFRLCAWRVPCSEIAF